MSVHVYIYIYLSVISQNLAVMVTVFGSYVQVVCIFHRDASDVAFQSWKPSHKAPYSIDAVNAQRSTYNSSLKTNRSWAKRSISCGRSAMYSISSIHVLIILHTGSRMELGGGQGACDCTLSMPTLVETEVALSNVTDPWLCKLVWFLSKTAQAWTGPKLLLRHLLNVNIKVSHWMVSWAF